MSLLSVETEAENLEILDTVVKEGEPAPFPGVLVPEQSYRKCVIDSEVAESCKSRLDNIGSTCAPIEADSLPKTVLKVVMGFIVGVLTAKTVLK